MGEGKRWIIFLRRTDTELRFKARGKTSQVEGKSCAKALQ
jgi:hypothetical protein